MTCAIKYVTLPIKGAKGTLDSVGWRVRQFLSLQDLNRDGKITKQEFKKFFPKGNWAALCKKANRFAQVYWAYRTLNRGETNKTVIAGRVTKLKSAAPKIPYSNGWHKHFADLQTFYFAPKIAGNKTMYFKKRYANLRLTFAAPIKSIACTRRGKVLHFKVAMTNGTTAAFSYDTGTSTMKYTAPVSIGTKMY